MRWDRLFAELEGQAEDMALGERDALVEELRDEEWSQTPWRSLVGGAVELEVQGVGRVAGSAELVNDVVVHLASVAIDHVVAADAVLTVVTADRRADPSGRVSARLGWPQLLRRVREDGDEVRVARRDGAVLEGVVDVVGRDFVRLATAGGRRPVVPFAGLAVLSFRR
ncbi:hypothetical protein ACHAAC_12105 [Aeromicrobium sp. CF4.19]|uniref:hypothetical protein n=1 Tax=Aeromicrobium sp. CF4.19 TaxID=3373082 RepID=UPI003EE4B06B